MTKVINFLKKEGLIILILLILAGVTRFLYLGHPKEVVFDEVYFAKWVTNYFKGEFYFDIHPPLVKMMLAVLAKIFGYSDAGNTNFSQIGNEYQTDFYKFLRGVESFFGILLVLGVYFLGKKMFQNKWPGFLAALLIIFDNAILVQSRFIFTDVFLLVFGVWGLYFIYFLKERRNFNFHTFFELFFAALFLTFAFLVKWTALIFWAVGIFILFLERINGKERNKMLFIKEIFLMGLIFVFLYGGVFAIHLLSLPYSGGPDADNFLSVRSQSALLGNPYYGKYEPNNLFKRIIELNIVMFTANARINVKHPYSSKWYSWPFMIKPIFEWQKFLDNQKVERIYLIGNPFIWWVGLACVLFVLIITIYEWLKKEKGLYFQPLLILISGYILNLLFYVFIKRPSFIYHYFPSFIFMVLMMGFVLWIFFKDKVSILILIFIIILNVFVYFAPLSYGLPLNDFQFNGRMWLNVWR